MRVCGAWVTIFFVLCSIAYSTLGCLFCTPAGLRRAARVSETRLLHRWQPRRKVDDRRCFNSLLQSGATSRHRSESILAKIMSCFLTVPKYYINQSGIIVNQVLWHSPVGNFTGIALYIYIIYIIYIYIHLIWFSKLLNWNKSLISQGPFFTNRV